MPTHLRTILGTVGGRAFTLVRHTVHVDTTDAQAYRRAFTKWS